MLVFLSMLAAWLAATPAEAATAGSIVEVGDTLVSAMMVRVSSTQVVHVLILDFAGRRCLLETMKRSILWTRQKATPKPLMTIQLGVLSGACLGSAFVNFRSLEMIQGHCFKFRDSDGHQNECVLCIWYASS